MLITSEASRSSRIEFFQPISFMLLMISSYDLFLAWFCSSDFDMVSVVVLIWVKIVIFDVGQKCDFCFFSGFV